MIEKLPPIPFPSPELQCHCGQSLEIKKELPTYLGL